MTVAVFAEATAKASGSERADVDLARNVAALVPAKMGNSSEGARETDGRAASTAHDLPHARDVDPVAVRGDVTLTAAANASPAFPAKALRVESPNSSLQSPDDHYAPRADRSTPSHRPSAPPRVDEVDVPTPAPRGDAPAHPTAQASLSDPVDGSAAAGTISTSLSPRDGWPESAGFAHDAAHPGGGGGRRANGHGNGANHNPAPLVFDEATREACARCFTSTDDEGRLRELCAMGQKELQETFRTAFRRATTSNNNQWLRRRIAGALGIENAFAPSSHAAPRDVGSLAGSRGERVGGAAAGVGGVAAGTVIAEDGVRKSSRAAKPKILDFLPSAVCVKVANEAPGEAAIDRRVRVFWPAEGAFFSGLVVAFNGKNGKHKIRYDDGDVEEVLLAAERIEWVEPGEDETKLQPRAPAIAAGGGALSSKAKAVVVAKPKMTTFVVPVAGKPAEVLAELGPAWPTPGAHVWGRVKGHGWWPGVVIKPTAADAIPASADAAHAMRRVRFFDNTGAAVHRHDLLPFLEYAPTLSNAKKSAGFQTAMKLARASFDKAAKRGLESNLASMTKSQQATAAKAAVGLIPDAAAATEGKRKHVDLADVGGGKRVKTDVAGGVVAELEAARAAEASIKAAGGSLGKPPIKRSHKKGQGLKARAAAEAAGLPWPPPKPERPDGGRGRGRGSAKMSNGGASARGFVAGLGRVGADAGDQLGLLSRKLEALQTRVVPLAIAASQHLRKQLQLSQLSASRGGQPHPGVIMTDRERATLLEEMESLQRLLSCSDPSRGGAAGAGDHAALFDHDAFDGAGARADADAAMRAERDGSDPDLARLDARWERGGLDPIEMAMLRGDADEPMVMSAMDASAAMDPPTMDASAMDAAMDGDGVWFTGEEDALDAAALLSAPGPAEDDVTAVIATGAGANGDANVEGVETDRDGGETMNANDANGEDDANGEGAMHFAVKANEATSGGYGSGSPSSETLATPAARASSPGAPRRASPATSDTTQ